MSCWKEYKYFLYFKWGEILFQQSLFVIKHKASQWTILAHHEYENPEFSSVCSNTYQGASRKEKLLDDIHLFKQPRFYFYDNDGQYVAHTHFRDITAWTKTFNRGLIRFTFDIFILHL